MVSSQTSPIELDVYITGELRKRLPGRKDSRAEKAAIEQLTAALADGSAEVLPQFVDVTMRLCDGVSAGISIYEETLGPGLFRWRHLRGVLARFEGATTPRDFSPCGVTLDRSGPVLASHPERVYDWIADAGIVIPEVLLVPIYIGGTEPAGTLWVVSDREGHFTREHARMTGGLASLVGAALCIERTEQRLRQTIGEQEMLIREMSHRVKNLFAVTSGLLRLSARDCATPQELVERYSARMAALSRAHDLAIRTKTPNPGVELGLANLVETILAPHDRSCSGSPSRFVVTGNEVTCGEHATNCIALILHELATNAVKYGALCMATGSIEVSWICGAEELVLDWSEKGGPPICSSQHSHGFGFELANRTLHQLGGRMDVDWAKTGLRAKIYFPLKALSA